MKRKLIVAERKGVVVRTVSAFADHDTARMSGVRRNQPTGRWLAKSFTSSNVFESRTWRTGLRSADVARHFRTAGNRGDVVAHGESSRFQAVPHAQGHARLPQAACGTAHSDARGRGPPERTRGQFSRPTSLGTSALLGTVERSLRMVSRRGSKQCHTRRATPAKRNGSGALRRGPIPGLDLGQCFGENRFGHFSVVGGLGPQPIPIGQAEKPTQTQVGVCGPYSNAMRD